ncbi:MAG TPA: hypothetical protein ENI58_09770 [Nitrospirae bacterium]|nr:hypothetical protein [Nitrospirota bacterium]
MNFTLFILLTYIMGFLTAIPVGAVQIEVARRAITGHLRSAIMVALGATSADILYGLVAFFGVVPVLKEKKIMAVFWLIGGVLLLVFGISLIRQGLQGHSLNTKSTHMRHQGVSLVTGFLLALTNPMMILWWLIGEKIVEELGLITLFTHKIGLYFLVIGGFGMFTYPGILAIALSRLKRSISPSIIMRVTIASGFLLLLVAIYFIGRSLVTLI